MLVELLSETTKLKLVVETWIGQAVETLVAPLKVVGRLFIVVPLNTVVLAFDVNWFALM
jgi:hypothetical protein